MISKEYLSKVIKRIDVVLESSYDGIYITDGEANTLWINKSYERISGVPREKMMGRNMEDLVIEGFISSSATLLTLENRQVNTLHQEFITGKKALVTSTPVFDEDGTIVMVVTNIRDITELDRLKDELEKKEMLAQKYYSELEKLRTQVHGYGDIVAEDNKTLETIQVTKRIAAIDTTVLLLGETGVGKEEIAKFIHRNGSRNKEPFIKINCGAIPENLIEAELFGYEKGSFTGASKEGKRGIFEEANNGTLFLDEVGELPLNMQVKLLRVLQESEVVRVGGVKPVRVNVRIIAATNRNLDEMVKSGQFREDLYYRLNVVPINIPPLRERRGDIIPLIDHYLTKMNTKYNLNKSFSSDALKYLYDSDWKGNVRELKNIVERAIVMSADDKITKDDLVEKVLDNSIAAASGQENSEVTLKAAVQQVERQLIEKAYERYGNVRAAAKSLGIDAATFVRKRKRHEKGGVA